jgi:hypothetical protein
MQASSENQVDYVRAITEIIEAMPLARRAQLYEFALFLKSRPMPLEETIEAIVADEARWEAQFEATDDDRLAALIAAVEAEISDGQTLPMFDERGEFNNVVLDWRPR